MISLGRPFRYTCSTLTVIYISIATRGVGQIVYLNNPLREVDEARYRVLANLFCNYDHSYAHVVMTVYLSCTMNRESATYATAVHNNDRMRFLENGYSMFIIYGHHHRSSVKMIIDDVAWSRMHNHYASYTLFRFIVSLLHELRRFS